MAGRESGLRQRANKYQKDVDRLQSYKNQLEKGKPKLERQISDLRDEKHNLESFIKKEKNLYLLYQQLVGSKIVFFLILIIML